MDVIDYETEEHTLFDQNKQQTSNGAVKQITKIGFTTEIDLVSFPKILSINKIVI